MRMPRFADLDADPAEGPTLTYASGSPALSGNPRLYKHVWQIFSAESPWEGDAFLEHAPYRCTADMLAEAGRLLRSGRSCVVYGVARPRRAANAPWDLTHPRWRNAVFAPAWEDDTDPVVDGVHK